MTARTRKRRRAGTKAPEGDGEYWVGGLMSRQWAERHSRSDWPEELARLLEHARACVDRPLGAEYLAELEHEWAQLRERTKG